MGLGGAGLRRGRLLAAHFLVAFGAVSAIVQFVGQLYPHLITAPGLIFAAALVLCAAWAVQRTTCRRRIQHDYRALRVRVSVSVADLFTTPGHKVVGFTDTFDTQSAPGGLISPRSVQGQLLERVYRGDAAALDRELAGALREQKVVARETRSAKRLGELKRYPLGTVAVLGGGGPGKVFALAYSRMGNDGVARSSVDDLWHALNRLWDAIEAHGERASVAMPLVGSGLARIDALDREGLARVIVQSFLIRAHASAICRELHLVISDADRAHIDLYELAAFLRSMDMADRT